MTAPSPPPGPDPARSSSKAVIWVPIVVAFIAAVGTLGAAAIGKASPTSDPPRPTTAAVGSPTQTPATTPAGCFAFGPTGGANAAILPNAQASTHDVTLQAASYAIDRKARPPTMLIAGQVVGRPPVGSHLWLVGNPDPRTAGLDGKPGSGRFYPAVEIQPDAIGCWRNPPQSVGYDEAIGITVTQLLVQVSDTASAEFKNRTLHPDGLDTNDLGRLEVDTIAFFDVPTKP